MALTGDFTVVCLTFNFRSNHSRTHFAVYIWYSCPQNHFIEKHSHASLIFSCVELPPNSMISGYFGELSCLLPRIYRKNVEWVFTECDNNLICVCRASRRPWSRHSSSLEVQRSLENFVHTVSCSAFLELVTADVWKFHIFSRISCKT